MRSWLNHQDRKKQIDLSYHHKLVSLMWYGDSIFLKLFFKTPILVRQCRYIFEPMSQVQLYQPLSFIVDSGALSHWSALQIVWYVSPEGHYISLCLLIHRALTYLLIGIKGRERREREKEMGRGLLFGRRVCASERFFTPFRRK